MYIFAVALQDGRWHHVDSYLPERTQRPDTVRLWHKIRTQEDPYWTASYHHPDPAQRAFGARVEIIFADGTRIEDEQALADAHPGGAKPFTRENYIHKFRTLSAELLDANEQDAFIDRVQRLPELKPGELCLNPLARPGILLENPLKGIF